MPIYKGSSNLKDIQVGNNKIKQVYYGSDLVYSKGYTLTINPYPANSSVRFSTGTASGNTVTVPYGTTVTAVVSCTNYTTQTKSYTVNGTSSDNIKLLHSPILKTSGTDTLTLDPGTWRVVCRGGGGGGGDVGRASASGVLGSNGGAGAKGELTIDTFILSSATTATLSVGEGGLPGNNSNSNGGAGGNSNGNTGAGGRGGGSGFPSFVILSNGGVAYAAGGGGGGGGGGAGTQGQQRYQGGAGSGGGGGYYRRILVKYYTRRNISLYWHLDSSYNTFINETSQDGVFIGTISTDTHIYRGEVFTFTDNTLTWTFTVSNVNSSPMFTCNVICMSGSTQTVSTTCTLTDCLRLVDNSTTVELDNVFGQAGVNGNGLQNGIAGKTGNMEDFPSITSGYGGHGGDWQSSGSNGAGASGGGASGGAGGGANWNTDWSYGGGGGGGAGGSTDASGGKGGAGSSPGSDGSNYHLSPSDVTSGNNSNGLGNNTYGQGGKGGEVVSTSSWINPYQGTSGAIRLVQTA